MIGRSFVACVPFAVYSPGKLECGVRWTKSAYDVFVVMNDAIASCHWLRCERCLCDVTMKGVTHLSTGTEKKKKRKLNKISEKSYTLTIRR